ncbi:MAG: AAA family ATPase [Methylibium sp.]|uniref:AAA family ATPase n=1 Tax=Methylibium sp. TaxID=2067992 RepID=UPI001832BA9F|nr:AAA family ATPase [Methylibium sp.]MBA3599495.1 AAA family ATPase [Methylibium sp.]
MSDERVRLATIADAVVGAHTRDVPLAKWTPPKHVHLLRSPAAFNDQIMGELSNDGTHGDPLPWAATHKLFRLRPHELSIWAGANGSYKSTVLSEIMLSLAMSGKRVVIISLEMPAYRVAAKMVIQALCRAHPVRKMVEQWAEGLEERLCFLDMTGDMAPADAVKLAMYCAHELGTQHILFDNLTKIVSADNDHAEQQRLFMAQMHRTAIDTGMHVHVVAHTRKPTVTNGKTAPPNRYDIAGSRTLSDQPDNVIMVNRNFAKTEKVEKGDLNAQAEPDLVLLVEKHRHGRFEGKLKLWTRPDSYRFADDQFDAIAPYFVR